MDEPTPHEVMIVLRGWMTGLSAAVDVCFTECRFRHKAMISLSVEVKNVYVGTLLMFHFFLFRIVSYVFVLFFE